MGVYLKQSVRSILYSGVGILLGVTVTFLSIRFFSKTEYGFQTNLNKYAQLLSYVGLFGVGNTLMAFGQKYGPNHPQRNVFLGFNILINIAVFLLILLFYFFAHSWITTGYDRLEDEQIVQKFFITFPVFTFFNILLFWFDTYLVSIQKSSISILAREIILRVLNILLIVIYFLNFISFDIYIYLYVVSILIPISIEFYYAKSSPGWLISFQYKTLPFSVRKEFFTYSAFHALSGVSNILIYQIDGVLIPKLSTVGFEGLAQYATASFFCNLLRTPSRMVGSAITPAFAKEYLDNNHIQLSNIYRKSALNLQLIAIILLALMLLNLNDIMKVINMIHPGYDSIKNIIKILLVGQMFEMMGGANYEIIGVTKYYKWNFWIANGLVIIITILMCLLIPHYGLMGAAWSFSIGLIVFSLSKLSIAYFKLGLQPFQRELLKVLMAVVPVFFIINLLNFLSNPFINAILKTGLFILPIWILLYLLKPSIELNALTHQVLKKLKLIKD